MADNLLNTSIAYFLFGASVEAAAIAIGFAAVYVIYIHSDTHSPHWLGWFMQRPEMHRVHHQAGVHKGNYSLPIWDMLLMRDVKG